MRRYAGSNREGERRRGGVENNKNNDDDERTSTNAAATKNVHLPFLHHIKLQLSRGHPNKITAAAAAAAATTAPNETLKLNRAHCIDFFYACLRAPTLNQYGYGITRFTEFRTN